MWIPGSFDNLKCKGDVDELAVREEVDGWLVSCAVKAVAEIGNDFPHTKHNVAHLDFGSENSAASSLAHDLRFVRGMDHVTGSGPTSRGTRQEARQFDYAWEPVSSQCLASHFAGADAVVHVDAPVTPKKARRRARR
jgi:hypothetical protein